MIVQETYINYFDILGSPTNFKTYAHEILHLFGAEHENAEIYQEICSIMKPDTLDEMLCNTGITGGSLYISEQTKKEIGWI
jgi:hypothetical protein